MSGLPRRAFEHAVAAIVAALFLRTFVLTILVVSTDSMTPTIQPGDRVLIARGIYGGGPPGCPVREPRRGDIVAFAARAPVGAIHVKRIAGVPGESLLVDGPRLFVDGALVAWPPLAGSAPARQTRLGADELFVLGDHSAASLDSRATGPIGRARLRGRVIAVLWSRTESGFASRWFRALH